MSAIHSDHFAMLQSRSLEWNLAWDKLIAHWGDKDFAALSQSGECWQYMGSVIVNGQWLHQFRHRDYPKTNRREYWSAPASPGWNPALQTADSEL